MSIQKAQKNEIVKFDREAFAARFSPKNIRKEFRHVNSLQKAVESDSNSLAVYRKQSSPEFIEGMIEVYLHDLNSTTNTHHNLTDEQIEELAQDITTLHFQMSLVEVHFVIKQGKRGKFGKVGTFAINEETVLGWFEKYAEDRCQYFMQRKTSEGIENKQNAEAAANVSPIVIEGLSRVKKEIDKRSKEESEGFEDVKDQYYKKGEVVFESTEDNDELNEKKRQLLGDNWKEIELKNSEGCKKLTRED